HRRFPRPPILRQSQACPRSPDRDDLMGGPTSRAKPESAERRLAPHGMVLVEGGSYQVGSSAGERSETARAYDCDPTWLNDELERRTVQLPASCIDQSPVPNAQYLAFVEATVRRPPWLGGTVLAGLGRHPMAGVGARD